MVFFCCFFIIWVFSNPTSAYQQFYDSSLCDSNTIEPGSRYITNPFTTSCKTFIVYRARPQFQSISQISILFNSNLTNLLLLNNLTSPFLNLKTNTDVLVPITCSSSGKFFEANFSYVVPKDATYSQIACWVFAGLVKSITLEEENPFREDDIPVGARLLVPLRCACPDEIDAKKGVNYFVTYPFVEGDDTIELSKKFGISPEELWAANGLSPSPTVYPNTAVLIPLKKNPKIYFNESSSQAPIPGFLPTVPLHQRKDQNEGLKNKVFIAGIILGILLVFLGLFSCWICVKSSGKWKGERLKLRNSRSTTARSSPASCLSPDLLSMCRFSLYHYSMEEIKKATSNFSENNKMGRSSYRGRFDDFEVIFKEMRSQEGTRGIVDIYSKINHINILQLLGVSYGEDNNSSKSFLVFEFTGNKGSLQDCLFNSSHQNIRLQWRQRTLITFDIATALYYLHHCTIPAYIHMSISSRNVLITEDFRAKISNFGTTSLAGSSSKGKDYMLKSVRKSKWVAPEFLVDGMVSAKVDVFAFGVVLFEIISGKQGVDGRLFKDCIKFLGGGGGGGDQSFGTYFDQLRRFVDPGLKEEDYPVAEALSLAVLAKACVEDDPLRRPSMNDILKVLARLI